MRELEKSTIILVLPAIVAVLAFTSYLLGQAFYLSLREYSPLVRIDEFIGFRNYVEIVGNEEFLRSILRIVIYTGIVVGIGSLLAMGMALLVFKGFRGANILKIVIISPMLLIPAAGGTVWTLLYNYEFGLINHVAKWLGFARISYLSSPERAFYAVILTDIWSWTPLLFLIFFAGLHSLPPDSLEAAEIDGATSWQKFWYVTLPLMRPIVVIGVLIKSVDTFRTFDYIWIMTKGGPGGNSHVIGTITYRSAFRFFRYGEAASMSIVSLMISLVMSMIFLWYYTRVTRRQV